MDRVPLGGMVATVKLPPINLWNVDLLWAWQFRDVVQETNNE